MKIILILILNTALLLPFYANAQLLEGDTFVNMVEQRVTLNENAGFANTSISFIISAVIKSFLSLLGIIFVILIIYAGFNWMTAGGDEEKVRKARDTIQKAIIGLIIIVAAYSITYFVFKYVGGGGGSSMSAGSTP